MLTKTDSIVSVELRRVSYECNIISKEQFLYGSIFTFDFAFRSAGFNIRLSDLLCTLNPIIRHISIVIKILLLLLNKVFFSV